MPALRASSGHRRPRFTRGRRHPPHGEWTLDCDCACDRPADPGQPRQPHGPGPYSIVRATQFFEFIDAVLTWTADENTVRLPRTAIQPIASADVARAVADVAVGAPLLGTRNIAGPDVFPLDELGRITLTAHGDKRTVVTDDTAGMFATMPANAIIAKDDAVIAKTRYLDWLHR